MTYKEYGKDFHQRKSGLRYLQSFIFADGFRDEKRFARYVSKVKSCCERAIRENFLNNEGEHLERDLFCFMANEIKMEAGRRRMDAMSKDEKTDVDNSDDCVGIDADAEEMDEEMAKFLVKRRFDEIGIGHEFALLDEIDKNFTHFHPYKFVDPRLNEMWDWVFNIFFSHYMLQEMRNGDESITDEEVEYLLDNEENILHNYENVCNLVECEFEECCFKYLHYRISEENSTVTYDNFTVHALPRGDGEALWIVSDAIDRAATDLLNACRDENAVKSADKSVLDQYLEDVRKAKEEKSEVEDKLAEEQDKNLALRKKLEGFEETKKKEFETIKTENRDLHIEKSRLEKKNASLEEENERLRKQLADLMCEEDGEEKREDNTTKEIDTSKVDVNKRYVFVMDENPYGKEQLLKSFPNSSIVDDYVELNPNGVDIVVCITSRVKHSVYNSTKDYCKQKGIKFVHCVQNNVEMIKRVLAEVDV